MRCPKSASNTAASATRRPARRLRIRSERSALAADAIDQDGDGSDGLAEQALDRQPDGVADLAAHRREVGAGTGDDAQLELDAVLPDANHDRRPGQRGAPRRTPPRDLEDVRDLEGREPRDLDDDAPADGQLDRLGRGPDRVGVDDQRILVIRERRIVGLARPAGRGRWSCARSGSRIDGGRFARRAGVRIGHGPCR